MKILSSDTQEINFSRPYKIESLSICIVVLYEITGLTKIYEKTYIDIHSLFIIIKKKNCNLQKFCLTFCKTSEYQTPGGKSHGKKNEKVL